MYIVTGANLHGQWFYNNPIFNGFETISRKKYDYCFDIDRIKLVYISWSYNIYEHAKKFYLLGSRYGKNKQFIELSLPKEDSNKNIILCGNDYNLFLFETDLHEMWVINLEDSESVKRINLKTEIEITNTIKRFKSDDAIVKVCASNFYCICLTADGSVYSGLLPGPLDISSCNGKVCDVQCGYEHYLLLTDTGRVYSWGNGRRLQLGHGDISNIETPKEIEALSGVKINKISAGGWHSLALSESGDLYSWGWNDTGQLGIKDQDHVVNNQSESHKSGLKSHCLPTVVDIFDEKGDSVNFDVKYISCGNLHSAIMLEDNSVWTSGCNKYGQLGFAMETTDRVHHFTKTYHCVGHSMVLCGPWVTVIESEV